MTLQTTFLPWATIKISTENDARKAELKENFPNIEPPVGALRILKNTAFTLEQKTENISRPVFCMMQHAQRCCLDADNVILV